jgi:hypothetical protein
MLPRESRKNIGRSNLLWITLVYLSSWMQAIVICHRNLASQMFAKIVENPAYEPKSIIFAFEEKFRYQISYGKAYMTKKKVIEMMWGTY